MPEYFPENNAARPQDSQTRTLQKINDILDDAVQGVAPFFQSAPPAISLTPGSPTTIRAATVLLGTYVVSSAVAVVTKSKVHLDFLLTGTPDNAGSIIAYLQVSDDGTNWRDIMGLVADTAATTDNSTTIVPSTMPVRQLVTEYNCIRVDYPNAALTMAKRVTLELGYGGQYRLQVRAANAAGVSTSAAAGTLPTLAINATLQ